MRNYKTSIIINSKTRDFLRTLGRKGQTFDDIINEQIIDKKRDAFDWSEPKAS